MQEEIYNINNVQVQLMMVIQLQSLQRQGVPALTYQNLEEYLSLRLWKNKCPHTLHAAASDIMSITASDLVRFLSQQTIKDSSSKNLADFSDVIGGNTNHE